MEDLGLRLVTYTSKSLGVSGLSCVALFKWADLDVDVVIVTLLWVGMRTTGITLAPHNGVVAIYCTSPYGALWVLSHLQVNVEPKAPQLRFSSSNPDPQPLWRFAAVRTSIALRRFPDTRLQNSAFGKVR
jgi:hypothetical protein